MKRRIGKFEVSVDLFSPCNHEQMIIIQKDMAVLHIESNFCTNKAKIFAIHPSFDEVDDGYITPFYEVLIKQGEDGNIESVTFNKLAEEP